jgi:transcriptional regulator with XRE-family HTH domain
VQYHIAASTRDEGMSSKLGEFIRLRRTEAGLSLRDVAGKIGITHVQLGQMERGRSPVQEKYWKPLEKAVPGVTVEKIEEMNSKERPIQLSLAGAPVEYQTLGLALARRIEREDLKASEMKDLLRILGPSK